MTDRELFIKALDALEKMKAHSYLRLDYAEEAINALSERLAQPEQSPVAHTLNCVCGAVWDVRSDGVEEMVHAPTTPQRPWVGLTEPERLACYDLNPARFASAIEAKLKEKNT